jgi:hypothetical protein
MVGVEAAMTRLCDPMASVPPMNAASVRDSTWLKSIPISALRALRVLRSMAAKLSIVRRIERRNLSLGAASAGSFTSGFLPSSQ